MGSWALAPPLDQIQKVKQIVPKGHSRTFLNHVAFICDDPLIQPLLPQIVVVNEHTLRECDFPAVRVACGPRVRLLRLPSTWMNAGLFVKVMRWLAESLAGVMADVQPIVYFDAYKAHVNARVFLECARLRLWPVVVPAKMTWLLQPLDTHAFFAYKVHLQKEYQSARLQAPGGVLGVGGLLQCVCTSTREVLDTRHWRPAFDGDGYAAGQVGLRARILSEVGLEVAPQIQSTQPTIALLQHCFPKRTRVRPAIVWRPLRTTLLAAVAPKAAAAIAPKADSAPPVLRRSFRLASLGAAVAKAKAVAKAAAPKAGKAAKAKAGASSVAKAGAKASPIPKAATASWPSPPPPHVAPKAAPPSAMLGASPKVPVPSAAAAPKPPFSGILTRSRSRLLHG